MRRKGQAKCKAPARQEPDTTGHEWDGIREFNNPLPRWWLWTFYATCIWGLAYTIAYPAWPLVQGATAGVLGFSTRAQVAADIAAVDAANAQVTAELAAAEVAAVAPGSPLQGFAVNAGAAVFRANCSQCHGSGAAGAAGYPNLLDDDWLWGGSADEILATVTHGVRNSTDAEAHYSEMPKFGTDGLLEAPQIAQAVEYVLQLSGQEHDAALAGAGAAVFADNCASCHGEDATGDRAQGAPNLTDPIWLYGGDRDTVTRTVTGGRFGVMPAWGQRLTEAQVKAVTLYVHQLGGGE
jgi:cytochrome c oxidase cbb3-type subunit 3